VQFEPLITKVDDDSIIAQSGDTRTKAFNMNLVCFDGDEIDVVIISHEYKNYLN
jgi:hypothetical protein